jgi:hypothetical protein
MLADEDLHHHLFETECLSVEHVELAKPFCRYLELAQRGEGGRG